MLLGVIVCRWIRAEFWARGATVGHFRALGDPSKEPAVYVVGDVNKQAFDPTGCGFTGEMRGSSSSWSESLGSLLAIMTISFS